jgi:hypothetical protein
MAKEWVSTGYCVGFNSDRGVMLDLDNMTFRSALRTAETLLKQYRLEGFLLIRSSPKNYHVVFNRYLSWKKITMILFSKYECLRWAVFKMREGQLTLRISKKNGKDKPKILRQFGKKDKLIKDYLEVFNIFRRY